MIRKDDDNERQSILLFWKSLLLLLEFCKKQNTKYIPHLGDFHQRMTNIIKYMEFHYRVEEAFTRCIRSKLARASAFEKTSLEGRSKITTSKIRQSYTQQQYRVCKTP